ncbi:hypothetical protein GQ43DRAFT_480149 [Delitschia confertaspora ATCC 74209]|uniref:GmrSD restriction endonucleases N-terminal domain-containing protein n=1 Tax=Delitschia confertaspora ATCC 74209 TaxID=1513339 RepID=A0A9P4MQS3_9PLEO|nr:hypothetical protein GQ43DRAFT_480149 [Delitschia confertaspora ATCC 74209]
MEPLESPNRVKDELVDDADLLSDNESTEDGDETVFRPRSRLPPPDVNRRPLSLLMKAMEDNTIDLEADYQRDVVWTKDRMTSLIDSLMEEYYIPPIIFNAKWDPVSDRWIRVCVDGKQRLSSVWEFVKGLIPCHDRHGNKWWFCDSGKGRSGKRLLSETTKEGFLDKEFVAFDYKELEPDQEEDLFARVQMGVQLTLAEKMRASRGPWQEFAKTFEQDFSHVTSLIKDGSRAAEFRIFLSCFSQILEVQYPSNPDGIPRLKTNHSSLPKLLQNKEALDDKTRSHLSSVFNTFETLVKRDPSVFILGDRPIKGPKTFSPVEFVATAVLISMYSESRNNNLLLGDIWELRVFLRQRHKDLRMNKTVWMSVWEFVDQLEVRRGVVGSTIRRPPRTDSAVAIANSRAIEETTTTAKQPPINGGRGIPPNEHHVHPTHELSKRGRGRPPNSKVDPSNPGVPRTFLSKATPTAKVLSIPQKNTEQVGAARTNTGSIALSIQNYLDPVGSSSNPLVIDSPPPSPILQRLSIERSGNPPPGTSNKTQTSSTEPVFHPPLKGTPYGLGNQVPRFPEVSSSLHTAKSPFQRDGPFDPPYTVSPTVGSQSAQNTLQESDTRRVRTTAPHHTFQGDNSLSKTASTVPMALSARLTPIMDHLKTASNMFARGPSTTTQATNQCLEKPTRGTSPITELLRGAEAEEARQKTLAQFQQRQNGVSNMSVAGSTTHARGKRRAGSDIRSQPSPNPLIMRPTKRRFP